MQLYLGCIHTRFEGNIGGVGPVVGIEYDMESCLAACVQRCLHVCEPASAQTGASTSNNRLSAKQRQNIAATEQYDVDPAKYITVVATPFLNDSDQKDSPQGSPCDDPNHPDAVTCPWCCHRFVKGKPDPTGSNKRTHKDD